MLYAYTPAPLGTLATAEAAANARFQAQRTGQPDALPDAAARARVAACLARNRAACDYANQLTADPGRFEREAETDYNETGYAHYATH